jgi:hypothetical protein
LDSTTRRKKHTSQQKGNQRSLCESIQSLNRSRLDEFVYSSPSRRNYPNEKCPSRTAAFASTPSVRWQNRTVQNLTEYVQGCVPELGFNLDEIDISDWEDRETRKVLVRTMMHSQTMHDTS